jgi:hypothetical protein
MSLRYAHLFDSTVRTEYERALNLAKSQIGPVSSGRTALPLVDVTGGDWKNTPAIKSRLAGGYCPSFHTDSTHLGVLAAQRIDAQALAADAQSRGWIDEAERHHALIARLDTLITQANPA